MTMTSPMRKQSTRSPPANNYHCKYLKHFYFEEMAKISKGTISTQLSTGSKETFSKSFFDQQLQTEEKELTRFQKVR
jgi:hypothetical protein